MKKEELEKLVAGNEAYAQAVKQAFDIGWNAALIAVATQIDAMKSLGDTAASFAAFVREFKRDDTTQ